MIKLIFTKNQHLSVLRVSWTSLKYTKFWNGLFYAEEKAMTIFPGSFQVRWEN